jgi:uncharacterized membrane protein
MPRSDPDAPGGDSSPPLTAWGRFTGTVSNFMLKPAPAGDDAAKKSPYEGGPTTIPEIEAAIKQANDKERLIGLLAAPVAAAIGLLITASLVANDPKAHYANGQIDKLHANPSTYVAFGAVAMVLALVMLGAAWFRKRLVLGIATALYGLSIFNLHFWGFGIPFIMIGAWYLVRAYRLSEKLKHAKTDEGAGGATGYRPPATRPQPSKRYTPPAAPIRRASKPKPGKELEAG